MRCDKRKTSDDVEGHPVEFGPSDSKKLRPAIRPLTLEENHALQKWIQLIISLIGNQTIDPTKQYQITTRLHEYLQFVKAMNNDPALIFPYSIPVLRHRICTLMDEETFIQECEELGIIHYF